MSENPLVSVIMPAYNSRRYIAEAIRSVLDQDYSNLELIVVDDGSTDGTPEVAHLFGDRVKVIEQVNRGPAAARNRGVSASSGEMLAFIDSDDIWLPNKLRAQVSYLSENDDVGIVYGRLIRWFANSDGGFDAPPAISAPTSNAIIVPEESGWIYPEMLLDSVIWIVSAMVRRSMWDTLGGLDETLRIGEDYDFFIRASRLCKIDELDQVVAYYRMHNQSTTQVMRSENFECMVLMRALDRFGTCGPDGREVNRNLLKKRLFKLHFDHGCRHYHNGNPQIALHAFQQAILKGQRISLKALVFLFLSFIKHIRS